MLGFCSNSSNGIASLTAIYISVSGRSLSGMLTCSSYWIVSGLDGQEWYPYGADSVDGRGVSVVRAHRGVSPARASVRYQYT